MEWTLQSNLRLDEMNTQFVRRGHELQEARNIRSVPAELVMNTQFVLEPETQNTRFGKKQHNQLMGNHSQ